MTYHIPREPDTWTPPAVHFTQPWVSGPDEMSAEEYEAMEQRWLDERAMANADAAPITDLDALTDPDDLPFD